MADTSIARGRIAQNVRARRDKQLEDNAARKIFNAVKSWRASNRLKYRSDGFGS